MKSIFTKVAPVSAGIAGVAGIFLPFSYGTSPLDTLTLDNWGGGWWPLGLPFFLALPIVAASIRNVVSARITPAETVIAYFVSALGALMACAVLVWIADAVTSEEDLIYLIIYGGAILIGAVIFVLGLRRQWFGEQAPIVAMQIVYILHCSWLLFLFYEDGGWDVGAFAALFAVVIYAVQISAFFFSRQSAT